MSKIVCICLLIIPMQLIAFTEVVEIGISSGTLFETFENPAEVVNSTFKGTGTSVTLRILDYFQHNMGLLVTFNAYLSLFPGNSYSNSSGMYTDIANQSDFITGMVGLYYIPFYLDKSYLELSGGLGFNSGFIYTTVPLDQHNRSSVSFGLGAKIRWKQHISEHLSAWIGISGIYGLYSEPTFIKEGPHATKELQFHNSKFYSYEIGLSYKL